MPPHCDVPGCEMEARGRLSVFRDPWTGGLYLGLCDTHWSVLVASLPMFVKSVGENLPGGNVEAPPTGG